MLQAQEEVKDVAVVLVHVAVVSQQVLLESGQDVQLRHVLLLSREVEVTLLTLDEPEQLAHLFLQDSLVLSQLRPLLFGLMSGFKAFVLLTREVVPVEHAVEVDV